LNNNYILWLICYRSCNVYLKKKYKISIIKLSSS
jgi:hypothetical protein